MSGPPKLARILNLHFLSTDTIDFDCDPRELQGQDELDALAQFVRALGRKLSKPVLLGLEGCLPDRPYAIYDPHSRRLRAI